MSCIIMYYLHTADVMAKHECSGQSQAVSRLNYMHTIGANLARLSRTICWTLDYLDYGLWIFQVQLHKR